MRRGIWALVPVKHFAAAKVRLAPRYAPHERARLAAAMLEDVLAALSHATGVAGTVLVTGEAGARPIAERHGAAILARAEDDGINPALRQGLDALGASGASGALVIPGDVPFAAPAEIAAAAAALAGGATVLVAARRDGGTNLLGLALPTGLPPCFGPHSLAKHAQAARLLGIEPVILDSPGLAIDVDIPADLAPDPGRPALGAHTARCLASLAGRSAAEAG